MYVGEGVSEARSERATPPTRAIGSSDEATSQKTTRSRGRFDAAWLAGFAPIRCQTAAQLRRVGLVCVFQDGVFRDWSRASGSMNQNLSVG